MVAVIYKIRCRRFCNEPVHQNRTLDAILTVTVLRIPSVVDIDGLPTELRYFSPVRSINERNLTFCEANLCCHSRWFCLEIQVPIWVVDNVVVKSDHHHN